MEKRSYTVTTSTGPLQALSDELLESVAAALAKSRRLKAAVASGNVLTRTLSIRGSVDVSGVANAILEAFEEVAKALHRAGVEKADLVDFAIVQDLPGDEFASARDDIVGTPDVAARLGISRQRVAQLVDQPGRFPHPIATVRGTHVWRWGDIADWIAAGARDLRRKKTGASALALAPQLSRPLRCHPLHRPHRPARSARTGRG